MQMVPSLMREENKESDDYEPKVVSLGPYHHGKHPKLKFVEDFKPEAVKMFIEDKNDGVFMHAILRDIGYAKSCYLEKFTSGYSDEVFARMMLQDACLILNYIGPTTKTEQSQKKIRIINQLGTVVYTNIRRDMYLLENQLLVVSKEDVKELREKEIIINSLGSDEQVVELYNALNTYEADDSSSYYDVKMNIEEHYNSKVKMWMAGLKENYFNNPWSIIALVGSVVLLILTILQTYYAGHDTGDKCCSKGKFHLD
ncbi:uncharacterized protein LOC107860825 isoform X2 [Capsicum annuum]|uniref:uncharacterized protein LOC107860825 isoform X2 n=1 Tax=Capsicum annuum TaxID=4072 RepID=UPI001FB17711|nr:uncharacterized protein LOC107860825 isoform X2 [Capsicum annuum]